MSEGPSLKSDFYDIFLSSVNCTPRAGCRLDSVLQPAQRALGVQLCEGGKITKKHFSDLVRQTFLFLSSLYTIISALEHPNGHFITAPLRDGLPPSVEL